MEFDDVLIEILNEYAEGKNVNVEVYCEKYPQYKDEILSKLKIAEYIRSDFHEEDLSGKKLAEYIILKELGRGGMGVVFLGIHSALSRLTAIKILPPSISNDKEALKKFQEEAKTIAKFNHPNIVPIYSINNERGVYYIAMGYVPGPTLKDILIKLQNNKNADPLRFKASGIKELILSQPAEQHDISQKSVSLRREPKFWDKTYLQFILTIVAEIADALSYAHQSNIIHGDIKPSNIILSNEGIPMIVDFGLSKDFKQLVSPKDNEFTGTLVYAAPEQIRENIANEKTDIWALGVTLYELITFKHPFKENTVKKTADKIIKGNLVPLRVLNKKMPIEVEAIVNKCLEVKPESRYESIEDFANDLRNYLESKPIKARPDGILRKTSKSFIRQPKLVSLLIALCFILPILFIAVGNHIIYYKLDDAEVYFKNKDYKESFNLYQKLYEVTEFWPYRNKEISSAIYLGIADNLQKLKEYDRAFDYYSKCVKVDPTRAFAYKGIGDHYYRNKNYKKALENYYKAFLNDTSSRNFWIFLIANVQFDILSENFHLPIKVETYPEFFNPGRLDHDINQFFQISFTAQETKDIFWYLMEIVGYEAVKVNATTYGLTKNPHKYEIP